MSWPGASRRWMRVSGFMPYVGGWMVYFRPALTGMYYQYYVVIFTYYSLRLGHAKSKTVSDPPTPCSDPGPEKVYFTTHGLRFREEYVRGGRAGTSVWGKISAPCSRFGSVVIFPDQCLSRKKMQRRFPDAIELDAIEKKPNPLNKNKRKEVRRPGLEPGFRRWQRLVITTTLSAQCALQCGNSNDLSISNHQG